MPVGRSSRLEERVRSRHRAMYRFWRNSLLSNELLLRLVHLKMVVVLMRKKKMSLVRNHVTKSVPWVASDWMEDAWFKQPGGPLAHKCKTLIEPSRLIMLTAQRFAQTFLGNNFVALHFRRHGLLKFCNAKKQSCFFPIPQAAECIARIVKRANAPVIYLSTDAAESETGLLQSLFVVNGKVVPLVKRPARNAAEKWDALLYRAKIEDDSQVKSMLDKTICAMSNVFIGAPGSTFTDDILRLRKDWGSASSEQENPDELKHVTVAKALITYHHHRKERLAAASSYRAPSLFPEHLLVKPTQTSSLPKPPLSRAWFSTCELQLNE